VVKELAAEHGACLRPVQLSGPEIDTGHVEQSYPVGPHGGPGVPAVAPTSRILRDAQCREMPGTGTTNCLSTRTRRRRTASAGPLTEPDAKKAGNLWQRGLDTTERMSGSATWMTVTDAGIRGKVLPARPRRHRSTRRRQDPLPCATARSTPAERVGKTYTREGRKTFRPSAVRHAHGPSSGRSARTEAPPTRKPYDYRRACPDARTVAGRLSDRFIQNLRRFDGL